MKILDFQYLIKFSINFALMAPEGISEPKCRMVWLYWYEVCMV